LQAIIKKLGLESLHIKINLVFRNLVPVLQ
jgi:hypothetical protein